MRVLSQQGPDAVGLQHVAAEAGVSHALITHYFGTYDALVEATVIECGARMREQLLAKVRSEPNPTPRAMVELYLEGILEPWYARMVGWALITQHQGTHRYADAIADDVQAIAGALERILEPRMRKPVTRADAEALLVAVWSLGVGYVVGRDFFWRALGREPNARRDRTLREAIGTFAAKLFEE